MNNMNEEPNRIDWKKELLESGRFKNDFERNLLENGAKNFIPQGIYLGLMYSRWISRIFSQNPILKTFTPYSSGAVLQYPFSVGDVVVREIKLSEGLVLLLMSPISEINDGSGQLGLMSFALIGLLRTKQEPIKEKVKKR